MRRIANMEEYLCYDRILACGGSWMVKKDLINAGQYDEIRLLAAEAAAIVKTVSSSRRRPISCHSTGILPCWRQ